MRIISTFLPAFPDEALVGGRQTILMAFDTLVGSKNLVVGFAIGRLDGPGLDDVTLTKPGQLILDRCRRYMRLNYPRGSVRLAGVMQVAGARQRVLQVLESAETNSFVLLVCSDNKVYDAAFPALGIDLRSIHMDVDLQ